MRIILCLMTAMVFTSTAHGGQWYVEQAAAPGGDGSSTLPFQTINEVKAVLKTGDTWSIICAFSHTCGAAAERGLTCLYPLAY